MCARRSPKELCAYLAQAVGSANEMEVHVRTAFELEYISKEESERFITEYQMIGKQLTNFMKYWRTQDTLR
ncbi:MAG: four helix bundle protein [Gemmatimonadaceae bacterium]